MNIHWKSLTDYDNMIKAWETLKREKRLQEIRAKLYDVNTLFWLDK